MSRRAFFEEMETLRKNHELDIIADYLTEDFRITNLKNNTIMGEGLPYVIESIEREIERGLIFKIINTFSVGDFEVYTYEVTVESGEVFESTILYRFRGERACELILLEHD